MSKATVAFHDDAEEILGRLDCEKIAKAMEAVGWTWEAGSESPHFPTAEEIRAKARGLLDYVCCEGGDSTVYSGGLEAYRRDGCGGIHFVLAAADCFCDVTE